MTAQRTDPALHLARAVLLAGVTVFLGVAGHATADGLLPGPVVLTLLLAAAVVPCVALLARPASTRRIVALLVAGQAAVHAVLSATAGHTGEGAAAPPPVPAGPNLPVVDGRRVGTYAEAFHDMVPAGTLDGAGAGDLLAHLIAHGPMMLAHALAATLVGLWLAVGERSLWTLVALAARVALRPLLRLTALLAASAPSPAPSPAPRTLPFPVTAERLARSVVRRGPPLLAA